ncbi:hypothetical protein ACFYUK_42040 [Nonomuraea wenchangensis]
MAGLLHVQLGADHPSVAFVGDELQQVQRLGNAAVVRERLAQAGGAAAAGASMASWLSTPARCGWRGRSAA